MLCDRPCRRSSSRPKTQAGNILFLILLAVVLFAALASSVTSSLRGGGNDVSKEQAKANAATIINYFALVESTVQRMVLTGVRPENLDFRSGAPAAIVAGGSNPGCINDECRLFKQINAIPAPRSASLKDAVFDSGVWTQNWEGRIQVIYISVKNIGTESPDIVLHYKGLSKEACDQINIMSGVYAEGDAPIPSSESLGTLGVDYAQATGGFPALTANQLGNIDGRIAGRQTFCILRGSVGHYAHHVIYAR